MFLCGFGSSPRTLYNLLIIVGVVRSFCKFVIAEVFLWSFVVRISRVFEGAETTSAMAETTVLKVAMSCQSCVGAVKKAIGKLEGVESYDIDIKEQKVTVVGNLKPEVVLDRVAKTGKATSFWPDESAVKPASHASSAPGDAVTGL